jgi:hypothetical protein
VANRPGAGVAVIVFVAFALTLAFAGTAVAHTQNADSVSCSTVTGSFAQFSAGDHPIVWNVAINGGAYQTVTTTESPAGFVGAGTASADISALTKVFDGSGGTVSMYAQWPGGQSAASTVHLDSCGTPPTTPPTTPTPPTTSGPSPRPPIVVVVSPAPVAFAPAPAAPVAAAPRTTG